MDTRKLLRRSIETVLLENKLGILLLEGTGEDHAKRYLKSRGYDTVEKRQQITHVLIHDIPDIRLDKFRYLQAGCRLLLDKEIKNEEDAQTFGDILQIVSSEHLENRFKTDVYDMDGLSLSELHNMFAEDIKEFRKRDRERSSKKVFQEKSDYIIVPINSFNAASKYSPYTQWCVTKAVEHYNGYVNPGWRFYFCLKDGYEQLQRGEKYDEGAPLNAYGLSMLAVLIDQDGNLKQITTRYNHDFNGEQNPDLKTTEQLEQVIKLPFYQTFRPYTREQLRKMGVITFKDAEEMIESGVDPTEAFPECRSWNGGEYWIVRLNDKVNIIKKKEPRKFVFKEWFIEIHLPKTEENLAVVVRDEGYKNLYCLDDPSEPELEKWVTDLYPLYAFPTLYLVENYYNDDPTYSVYDIAEGRFILAPMNQIEQCGNYNIVQCFKTDKGWNFFDVESRMFISREWFKNANIMRDGTAVVVRHSGEKAVITKQGNLLLEDDGVWTGKVDWIPDCKLGVVYSNGSNGYQLINLVDDNRKLLSEDWFTMIKNNLGWSGIAAFKYSDNGPWYFVDKDGYFLDKKFFNYGSTQPSLALEDNLVIVDVGGVYQIFEFEGDGQAHFITDLFFDKIETNNGEGMTDKPALLVTKHNKFNFIDRNGLVCPEWLESASVFSPSTKKAQVTLHNGKTEWLSIEELRNL